MIIIEGPDNSGKSGIANYLHADLGVPLYHAGGPPKSKEDIVKRAEFLLDNYGRFIFDRAALISEPVYSLLRHEGNSLLGEELHLYSKLRNLNPIIIYCRPPIERLMNFDKHVVKKEYDTPDHVAAVEKNAMQLINRYDQLFEDGMLPPHIPYDYSKDDKAMVTKTVRRLITERHKYWPHFSETFYPPKEYN